jgi:hypothetical protein
MSYPVWALESLDGGAWIALIAIAHVFISHLAVGGGFYLVVTETLARRRQDVALLAYVRRHTWFFLLLTMVFGGLSGVGIWFIIALVQPAATGKLIGEFVFGWAVEWVFFIVEIVALLLYHYLFARLRPRPHLILGWIYAVAAWLSLAIIHGILSFMLTPGRWLQTHSFWDGFFNPGYFPGLAFRTAWALVVAGLFGLVTACRQDPGAERLRLTRYAAAWVLWPFLALLPTGWAYYHVSQAAVGGPLLPGFRVNGVYLQTLVWAVPLLFTGALLVLLRLPRVLNGLLVAALVATGLAAMGAFEYLRENARRPWVIYGYMYSNGILAEQEATLNQSGFLSQNRWVDTSASDGRGAALFAQQCRTCHTLDGHRALRPRLAKFDVFGLRAQLTGQGRVNRYMPPFVGTEEEKTLLARYLVRQVQGQEPPAEAEVSLAPKTQAPPPVPRLAAGPPPRPQYVLLAWSDLGMHCLSDNNGRWLLLPPANTLWAQLIQRGDPPQVVSDGVSLEYEVESDHAHPEAQVDFWRYAPALFGTELAPGIGLAGKALSGTFDLDADRAAFTASMLPVTPYRDDGSFDPYPQLSVLARGSGGQVLATTRVTAPVSTELGCRNCHGGPWRRGVAGLSDATADDVLASHDRLSGTDLQAQAQAGRPHRCQDCHADPALGASGQPGVLNLSAAMHGFHAHYLTHLGPEACSTCHPGNPAGATRCLRGRHGSAGMSCCDCHGTLSEHALSLLRGAQAAGVAAATPLMQPLRSASVPDVVRIQPRQPWVQEPDCLNCHQGFTLSRSDSFNRWTAGADALYRHRSDLHGVMCPACHGAPHAEYPALNAYGPVLDNYGPLQYQGEVGPVGTGSRCWVCHTVPPTANGNHRNMLRVPATASAVDPGLTARF